GLRPSPSRWFGQTEEKPSATRYSFNFRPKENSVNRRTLFSTKILSAVVGVIAAGFWRATYKEIAAVAINAPVNATERKRRKFKLLIQIEPLGARLAVLGCRSRRACHGSATS